MKFYENTYFTEVINGFLEVQDLQNYLKAVAVGFSKDFRLYWEGIEKELEYWKAIGYDNTDGSSFVIALYPSGSVRVKSDDTGYVGGMPEALYIKILVSLGHRTHYTVVLIRNKEEQA